jgi:predicted  nucleic acid-binding Zn-ribbon protein
MKRTIALLLGLLAVQAVMAKDAATEQYNVSVAREQYNDARSEYESVTDLAEAQAGRVAQEQARLDELRKRQKAARTSLDIAKGKLKQREQALDKAWGN